METRLFSITGEIRSKKGQKGRKAGRPFYGQAKQRRQEGTRPKQMSLEILKRRRRKYCKWDRGKYGIRGNRLYDKEKNGSLPAGQLKQMLLKAWKLRTPIWKNLKCFHDIHLNAKCHWFRTKLQMGNTFCIMSLQHLAKQIKKGSFWSLSRLPFDQFVTVEASAPSTGGDGSESWPGEGGWTELLDYTSMLEYTQHLTWHNKHNRSIKIFIKAQRSLQCRNVDTTPSSQHCYYADCEWYFLIFTFCYYTSRL